MKKLIALLLLFLALPAWCQFGGPKEVDNSGGKLDGRYIAQRVKVIPGGDKEPFVWKDVVVTLEQLWITMQPKDVPAIKSRIGRGSIYDYGYKVEIDFNHEDTRYQILIERAK